MCIMLNLESSPPGEESPDQTWNFEFENYVMNDVNSVRDAKYHYLMSLIKTPPFQKVKSILKRGGGFNMSQKFWMRQQNLVNVFLMKKTQNSP